MRVPTHAKTKNYIPRRKNFIKEGKALDLVRSPQKRP